MKHDKIQAEKTNSYKDLSKRPRGRLGLMLLVFAIEVAWLMLTALPL
jgi:hypothetical protein